MKGFKRGEKGFTLVELLIVVAILGVLAAVVIPNVVGLLGRGGKQAYETDLNTVQLAAATFYSDIHAYFNDDATIANRAWCDSDFNTDTGHFYPTKIGLVVDHTLVLSDTAYDPDNTANYQIVVDGTADADDADIYDHAIWMGLLVNAADDYTATAAGLLGTVPAAVAERGVASPQGNETALYLNEVPTSASQFNGAESSKAGTYTWVVGKNGTVYGVYQPGAAADSPWYAGFSGNYP